MFTWTKEAEKQEPAVLHEEKTEDRLILEAALKVENRHPAAVGVDINKGFLSVSIANQQGGLLHTFDMNYRFASGTRTESDLALLAARIAGLGSRLNVPVVIEDISLSAKKYRTHKGKNRALNGMLHSFAYRMYKEQMRSACYRRKVELIPVNPAWTSEIARRKYCIPMKLCVHNGAAWVIARRGMGIDEKLPELLSPEKRIMLFRKGRAGSLTKKDSLPGDTLPEGCRELRIDDDTLPF